MSNFLESNGQLSTQLSPLVTDSRENMVSTFNQEMGFAPPPPYFVAQSAQWSSRLSESTSSTHGSQSRLESMSMQSSTKNEAIDRPVMLQSFTGVCIANRVLRVGLSSLCISAYI